LISTPIIWFDQGVANSEELRPEEIVELFAERFPDHEGLDILRDGWHGTWPVWARHGLFAPIDGWPQCSVHHGRGRGAGTETKYFPEPTLTRLDYILFCLNHMLSVEQVLLALEEKIPRLRLGLCRGIWTFKVTLTKPLLLLVDPGRPPELSPDLVHQALWQWNTETQHAWEKLQARGLDASRAFEYHRDARYHAPVGSYIEPPVTAHAYLADWLSLSPEEAMDVVQAIRNLLTTKAGVEISSRQQNLLKNHAHPDYKIEIRQHGEAHLPKEKAPPAIYEVDVDPSLTPMTLLQQATAHALEITRLGRDEWVRKCRNFVDCKGLFPADDPRRELCDKCMR
jgi:hypothetical protein